MNIIETAKAILQGEDIDPMEVVRAVARLEPVASADGVFFSRFSPPLWILSGPDKHDSGDVYLYTLEADK